MFFYPFPRLKAPQFIDGDERRVPHLGQGMGRATRAEEAGRVVVRVNPAYTSQTCSACGHRQPMPLSVRVYECPHCGLVIHRDYNGSKNILAEAFHAVGRHSHVIPEAPAL